MSDYETAARARGWRRDRRSDGVEIFVYKDVTVSHASSWEDLCHEQGIKIA